MNELLKLIMKIFRTATLFTLCLAFLVGTTSCLVLEKHDNGKHKGWSKNGNKSNSEKSRGNHKK